jgi:hypothetical protein
VLRQHQSTANIYPDSGDQLDMNDLFHQDKNKIAELLELENGI